MRAACWGSVLAIVLSVGVARAAETDRPEYVRDIWPILREKCTTCHGAKKAKGGFRLHTLDALRKAIDEDALVVSGNPKESPLFARVSLPAADENIMPPEGETLSDSEVKLLRAWVEKGALIDDAAWQEVAADEYTPREIAWPEVAAADPGAVKRLRAAGALVVPIARQSNLLQVSFPDTAPRVTDAVLKLLVPLAPQIAHLDLSATRITDAGLAHVSGLRNLRNLRLRATAIGDAGVAHLLALSSLESVTLVGTRVTTAGLARLRSLSGLRSVYAWSSPAEPSREN